jgi:hypothetical protein
MRGMVAASQVRARSANAATDSVGMRRLPESVIVPKRK